MNSTTTAAPSSTPSTFPGWAPGSWFYATIETDLCLAMGTTRFKKRDCVFVRKATNGNYAMMNGKKDKRVLSPSAAKAMLRAHRDESGKLVPCEQSDADLNAMWGV